MLILRSVRDQNGKYEGFEDLAGDYHKDDVNYATNIWPLRCTPVYTGTAARFSEGDVYQRVMVPKFWELPEGWMETGARTSLIRAYDDRVPRLGTVSESFIRAADTALLKGYSYWGLPTDNGTPGYR